MKEQIIVLDSNIWISYILNKKFHKLVEIIFNNKLQVFVCDEMISEIFNVLMRPKFIRYISKSDINEALILITKISSIHNDYKTLSLSRDKKDDYIIALSKAVKAKFIITGDKDLLEFKHKPPPDIISLSEFINYTK